MHQQLAVKVTKTSLKLSYVMDLTNWNDVNMIYNIVLIFVTDSVLNILPKRSCLGDLESRRSPKNLVSFWRTLN